jgi:hypothetical protein
MQNVLGRKGYAHMYILHVFLQLIHTVQSMYPINVQRLNQYPAPI